MQKSIALLLAIFSFCLALNGCGTKTTDKNTNEPSEQIIDLADKTVLELKERLKNPESLYLYSVTVVEANRGKTSKLGLISNINEKEEFGTVTYSVYVDYSAKNGMGNDSHSYFTATYYIFGTEAKVLDAPHEISSISQLEGKVYEIDKTRLGSYSDTIK